MSSEAEVFEVAGPGDISPSHPDLAVDGVFNPAVLIWSGAVHLLLRVAERAVERREGWYALPSYTGESLRIVWIESAKVERLDARGVRDRRGRHHLLTVSHLRHAVSHDGLRLDHVDPRPFLSPCTHLERFGVEDARLIMMPGESEMPMLTYVAVSEHGICTAIASTEDFKKVKRHDVAFPPENKNVVVFPKKVDGMFLALHRPHGATPLGDPGIWLARSPDLVHWGRHEPLSLPVGRTRYVRYGAGPPPLWVDGNWLLLLHAVVPSRSGRGPGRYDTIAALLDGERPARVSAVSREPIVVGDDRTDDHGRLGGVVFPTGCVVRDDRLLLYCGERDEVTTVRQLSLGSVLDSLS